MHSSRLRLAALASVHFGTLVAVPAADSASTPWPQFRGALGSGIAADATPPFKIGPTEGVPWKAAVPWSPSSPTIWGDHIFLTTFNEDKLETRCHNRADRKLRWIRGEKPAHVEDFHRTHDSPAASTPATDGRHVVSYFGSFGLICHDVDGHELWGMPLPAALSGGKYGSGTSPVIIGTRVLLNRDHPIYSTLLAVDLRTGAKLRETPRTEASGSFGSPTHWRSEGVDEVVLAGSAQLMGYDLTTGAERWAVKGVTDFVCTTAVVADGRLHFGGWSPGQADAPREPWADFLKKHDKNGDRTVTFDKNDPAGRDYLRGFDHTRDDKFSKEDWLPLEVAAARAENLLIAVKPGGRGEITARHVVWKFRCALPYVPSPLHYDGLIYFVKDCGLISSLDAKTGEPFYAQAHLTGAPSNYYASPVAAYGRLYLASLPGKLTVAQTGGTKPKIIHQADFGSHILTPTALVGDKLYPRTTDHFWAFGKEAPSSLATVAPLLRAGTDSPPASAFPSA